MKRYYFDDYTAKDEIEKFNEFLKNYINANSGYGSTGSYLNTGLDTWKKQLELYYQEVKDEANKDSDDPDTKKLQVQAVKRAFEMVAGDINKNTPVNIFSGTIDGRRVFYASLNDTINQSNDITKIIDTCRLITADADKSSNRIQILNGLQTVDHFNSILQAIVGISLKVASDVLTGKKDYLSQKADDKLPFGIRFDNADAVTDAYNFLLFMNGQYKCTVVDKKNPKNTTEKRIYDLKKQKGSEKNINRLNNIADELRSILGGADKNSNVYDVDEKIRDLKDTNKNNDQTIYGCKKLLDKLNGKLKSPVVQADSTETRRIEKNIAILKRNLVKLENRIHVLLGNQQHVKPISSIQLNASLNRLMARVARINNFACTGKWYCPECGTQMVNHACRSCGYTD